MDINVIITAVALLLHYIEKKDISFFLFPVIYSNGVKMVEVNSNGLFLYLVDLIKANKPIPAFLKIRPYEKCFRVSSRRTRDAFAGLVKENYTVDLPYRTISAMLADIKYTDIIKPYRKWEKIAFDAIVNNDIYDLLDKEFVADNIEDVDIITTQKAGGYKLRYECKYSEGLMSYGGYIEPQEIESYVERVRMLIES